MHGNVTEWCLDWGYNPSIGWSAYAPDAVTDPEGPDWTPSDVWADFYRRARGGSFGDAQNALRSGARGGLWQSHNWLQSSDASKRAGIRVCCPIGSGVTL